VSGNVNGGVRIRNDCVAIGTNTGITTVSGYEKIEGVTQLSMKPISLSIDMVLPERIGRRLPSYRGMVVQSVTVPQRMGSGWLLTITMKLDKSGGCCVMTVIYPWVSSRTTPCGVFVPLSIYA